MKKGTIGHKICMAAVLVIAAALMAVGMELLQQSLLPPIYVNADEVAEGTATYIHPVTGKLALVEQWSALRLIFTFVIQLSVLIFLFPLKLGRTMVHAAVQTYRSVSHAVTEDVKKTLLHTLLFLAVTAGGFFLIRALAEDALKKSNWMIDTFSILAACAAAMLVTFRRTLGAKPEIFFLILTLMTGGILSFMLPDATAVSWDDGHHFQHALNYSTIGHVRFTQQDMEAMEAHNVKNYSLGEDRKAWLEEQDRLHADGAVYVTHGFHMRPTQFWTGTYGLGLFLGRLFHLSYWMTWSLGRFTGLLAYALIGFFAIRRLHSGKMILASVLMIPEAVFLASNYSYDPGVTSLIALGLSYCFVQWQEPEKKIQLLDELVMIIAMAFGCLAKAIYFPVLLFPLLLPKSKFTDSKHHKRFIAATVSAILLLLASFVIPFLTGSGEGDTRGGSDVNAFGQAQFILTHPLEYTEILLRFLRDYLSWDTAPQYLGFFAYMGWAPNLVLYQMIMAVVIFTDKRETDEALSQRVGVRSLMLFLLFGTICLVATSLYVSYTPVGSRGISGCQPRYLIPLVFPIMMLLGSGKIRNHMNQALYNGLVFAGTGYVGFCAALFTCIANYT
ncbi:MAG: DUF2142 domain-containing protein [Clostridia bacterium]|nr:DUF2142 domain-containing protein [Clostridia bacterium]